METIDTFRPKYQAFLESNMSDAEIEEIGRCFAQIEKIKRQSLDYDICQFLTPKRDFLT